MSDTPRHETRVETTPETDETITIPASVLVSTMSYLDSISMERIEREKRKLTSHNTILADVLSCLDVLKGDALSREVIITVTADKYGEPVLVKQRYVIKRNDYGKGK